MCVGKCDERECVCVLCDRILDCVFKGPGVKFWSLRFPQFVCMCDECVCCVTVYWILCLSLKLPKVRGCNFDLISSLSNVCVCLCTLTVCDECVCVVCPYTGLFS